MTALLKWISFLGLALTVAPAFFVFNGAIAWETHATWMLVGTLLWFVTAPFWMRERADEPV
jgi:thiosulfate reductase cytochrome b subunit